jgi:hypothetical protein
MMSKGLEGRLTSAVLLVVTATHHLTAQNRPVDSLVMRPYEAHATVVHGEVSRIRDARPWAVSRGEQVPIQQVITTGSDGYAHFVVGGGGSFDIFSNSRLIFRQNTANVGDLLDLLAGHVRIHLEPTIALPQQRVFTSSAIITAHQPSTIALAVDEDDNVRLDVIEGEVRVQHALLPRNDPLLVRAMDAVVVQKDEPISRRADRGSLYRYTVRPLHDIWIAITPGHSGHAGEPIEQKVLARAVPSRILVSF